MGAGLPAIGALPIRNNTGKKLHVMLEPEGQCLTLEPGEDCKIVPLPSSDETPTELELVCEEGVLTVHLMAAKEAFVAGKRVR